MAFAVSGGHMEGGSLGQLPTPKRLWRPSDKNGPLFGAYRSKIKNKNTKSKLNGTNDRNVLARKKQ